MVDEPKGLLLGEELDAAGQRNGVSLELDPGDLTTHGVVVGMTGSGKTGLAVVLLEEALLRGVPALILDPKGDMGNLLLNFPALRPEDFRPWVDEAEAARSGETPDVLAARTAERWRQGLADWSQTPDRMRRLGMGTHFSLFTPGSSAGIPLDVVGSLRAPAATAGADAQADEIEGFVSGLLALIGKAADPLSSPEHILLSNLIARAWGAGQDLDLGTLVRQLADPPIRKLGVFELDTFMPPKDRMALAVQLNALLASPSFASWMTGVPLDLDRILYDDAHRPRAAILYLAHLSEPERQFLVTLVMSRLVGWMRRQPGTSELRALVYMDEVAGFLPPTAEPASKKPMLTIFKQARAHGLGMVLATQNPVDLDYKAMANAGTWLIGRLQTERDKLRILEGMRAAAGATDTAELDRQIGALGPRQFLLHSARGGAPRRFTTRWAMSYLRGPLTGAEIERLTADDPERSASAEPAGQPAAAGGSSSTPAEPALADDEVTLAPTAPPGVRVRYLDPAAPWADDVGARADGRRLAAAVAARVRLKFDDTVAGIDHDETYECVFFPLTDSPGPDSAHVVDYDERDLRSEPPADAVYALPDAPIDRAAYFRDIERRLRDQLYRTRTVEVWHNPSLKLFSRVGEEQEAFAERCRRVATERAEAEAATLRDRYHQRLQRLQTRQRAADDRVRELTADSKQRLQTELVAGAGQLLSVFLGGRARLGSLSAAASRRATTRRTQERLDTARNKVEDIAEQASALEQDLLEELAAITEEWDGEAARIDERSIPLEQSDVVVEEVVLVWLPT